MNRVELFRLLGDTDRLRLLALCSEEELAVGELAELLGEAQPQVTKKTQPLRDAGLLVSRRDGTRTLLRTAAAHDQIVEAAVAEGQAICRQDGSLSRIARLVAERDHLSRQVFANPAAAIEPNEVDWHWLAILAPLIAPHRLAIDLGTGDGQLLPILASIFDRVVAVDRSAARLAHAASRAESHGLRGIRFTECDATDLTLREDVLARGGADLVVISRLLHYAPRPAEIVSAAAALLAPGGTLLCIVNAPHDDEALRSRGHVWLGFAPTQLTEFFLAAQLTASHIGPLAVSAPHPLVLAVATRPALSPN